MVFFFQALLVREGAARPHGEAGAAVEEVAGRQEADLGRGGGAEDQVRRFLSTAEGMKWKLISSPSRWIKENRKLPIKLDAEEEETTGGSWNSSD